MLSVTGSGPVWTSQKPSLHNPRYKPDPKKFADFATAVARRYRSKVDRYLIWNEPNQPGWLQPQFDCPRGPRSCVPAAPHLYRNLVNAAGPATRAADPGAQIVVGPLPPRGPAPSPAPPPPPRGGRPPPAPTSRCGPSRSSGRWGASTTATSGSAPARAVG